MVLKFQVPLEIGNFSSLLFFVFIVALGRLVLTSLYWLQKDLFILVFKKNCLQEKCQTAVEAHKGAVACCELRQFELWLQLADAGNARGLSPCFTVQYFLLLFV